MTVNGFPDHVWAQAKEEAKEVLAGVARGRNVIAYSDLAAQVSAISFLASDQRFFLLLREISAEEYRDGRGMLTAVVVHRSGDYKPGPGFFDLARSLGLSVADTDRLWIEQLTKVHDHWGAQGE
jgi:hypothetical protein